MRDYRCTQSVSLATLFLGGSPSMHLVSFCMMYIFYFEREATKVCCLSRYRVFGSGTPHHRHRLTLLLLRYDTAVDRRVKDDRCQKYYLCRMPFAVAACSGIHSSSGVLVARFFGLGRSAGFATLLDGNVLRFEADLYPQLSRCNFLV